ncbi:Auxin-repressed 12.5 kDa [Gossypium arboreum]|uniref:Auxin-repressed 12.5 kDa n=1 Tax=Gossypium arboreum TaxID=29729 RepID=A0A0B0NNA8_GOSAR|nr:Auxin-repressed 12.5 kDa [Gossypium arboreum]
MVLLDKMWDDVVAGPQPERGLGRLRKITTQPLSIKDEGERKKYQRSLSLPNSPVSGPTPVTPTTPTARKENVWRSVFHPGSNLATKSIGSDVFDKPQPNSPTQPNGGSETEHEGKLGYLFGRCVEIIPFDQYTLLYPFMALQWGDQEQASLRGWRLTGG